MNHNKKIRQELNMQAVLNMTKGITVTFPVSASLSVR